MEDRHKNKHVVSFRLSAIELSRLNNVCQKTGRSRQNVCQIILEAFAELSVEPSFEFLLIPQPEPPKDGKFIVVRVTDSYFGEVTRISSQHMRTIGRLAYQWWSTGFKLYERYGVERSVEKEGLKRLLLESLEGSSPTNKPLTEYVGKVWRALRKMKIA